MERCREGGVTICSGRGLGDDLVHDAVVDGRLRVEVEAAVGVGHQLLLGDAAVVDAHMVEGAGVHIATCLLVLAMVYPQALFPTFALSTPFAQVQLWDFLSFDTDKS